jgi:hypothetical protein
MQPIQLLAVDWNRLFVTLASPGVWVFLELPKVLFTNSFIFLAERGEVIPGLVPE